MNGSGVWGSGQAGGSVLPHISETSPAGQGRAGARAGLTGHDRTEAVASRHVGRGGGATDGKQVGGGWEAGDR